MNGPVRTGLTVRPDPEYYIGHVETGWDSRLFTNKRTYHIGDMYEGYPVTLVGDHRLVLLDQDTGEYIEIWMPGRPHE